MGYEELKMLRESKLYVQKIKKDVAQGVKVSKEDVNKGLAAIDYLIQEDRYENIDDHRVDKWVLQTKLNKM